MQFASSACLAVAYFSTLSYKRHDFRQKKLLSLKRVLISSTSFASNISHSMKNSARCYKFPQVFMQSTRYFQILITLEFSLPIFIKTSSFKFHKNASSRSRVFPCRSIEGRTDGHDEANSRVLQFCERS